MPGHSHQSLYVSDRSERTGSSHAPADYHWIGETFLGSWRVWSNHAWRSGLHLPPIKRIAFPKVYGEAEKPMDSDDAVWEDRPGANAWFMHKFL